MSAAPAKMFRIWLLRRTFRLFAAALVVSCVVSALYGDRLHMVYALCACGSLSILAGWINYLRMTGSRASMPRLKTLSPRIPFLLQKQRQTKLHLPAFLMNGNDFDDDLTDQTALKSELFNTRQQQLARILTGLLAGVLMFVASLLIHV